MSSNETPPEKRSREELKAALREKRASARNPVPVAKSTKGRVSVADELLRRGIYDPLILNAAKDPARLVAALGRAAGEAARQPTKQPGTEDTSDEEALPPDV